ncbi:uncharacterized protein EDB91DRAFT_755423 [Suillus paluster]|uniref:uncharacterized protein n=1 Tax=Suillus paluster TaxID=48578 RepID=UPI001B861440|nr:uncharacterized protein EDB91DRAFT_755423 [Suillus paluster]KAG1749641.1 hypothetical protein EDB91DRAFT_755423 [Suillus paluster]
MGLSPKGILAAVTIAMYTPFLLASFKVVSKYGIARGWILLMFFCIIRIMGGSFLVAAEEITPVHTGLYIGGYALEASGLSPLLLCTLGLFHLVFQTPDGGSRFNKPLLLLELLGLAAVCLTVFGIVNSSSSSANIMRRTGVILFVVLYIIVVGICLFLWSQVRSVMKYRKQLLKVISIALPFLAVRTVYSVLSMFSSSTFVVSTTSPQPNTSDLAKFNILTGEWQIFLVMDMLMEYAVVIIYTVAGLVLPLNLDYKSPDLDQDEYSLSRPQY